MSASLATFHAAMLDCKEYMAQKDFPSYGHWENMPGRDNAHIFKDDEGCDAILVVIGQVTADRLAVGPLGNFQLQEEKQFDGKFHVECKDAKIQFSLRRPTSYPEFAQDYDQAIQNADSLQEKVAHGTAQRLWFIDKAQKNGLLRFSRSLWEKKDFFADDSGLQEGEDDDDYQRRKANALAKADMTTDYIVPARFKSVFEQVSDDYNIDIPPVFLATGKLVETSQLAVRLPNALVEVMFSLRHYYITDNKKINAGTRSSHAATTNSFIATMEQLRILKSHIEPKKGRVKKMLLVKTEKQDTKRKDRDDEDDETGHGRKKKKNINGVNDDTASTASG